MKRLRHKAKRRAIFVHGSLKRVAGRVVNGAAVATLVTLFFGCTVVKPVAESADQKQLKGMEITCESPFPLTQDCSNWSGAKKLIVIDEVRAAVAGSAAGDILLVQSGNKVGEAVLDTMHAAFNPLWILAPQSIMTSRGANDAYFAVKRLLDQNGISVKRTHAMRSLLGLTVLGYVVELDGDGYSVLRNYTLVEQSPVEANGEKPDGG